MNKTISIKRQRGFTLVELLISMVVGGILVTSLFKIWDSNQRETNRIETKSEYRDRTTLATSLLNHSIMMAGFGMSKMDVLIKSASDSTDTLTLYSNASEVRTTLVDTAQAYTSEIVVFNDSGFAVGEYLGITDSLHQEFNLVTGISGDSASGFRISFASPLAHQYYSGVPDIYPVQKEVFYIDGSEHSLVRIMGNRRSTVLKNIQDFRISLLDRSGNPALSYKTIRVVTFSLEGTYNPQSSQPQSMRFSSTVIPRNIL